MKTAPACIGAVTTALALVLMLGGNPAEAAAHRTWVSANGDDANQCTRLDPCRTLAAALTNTSPGGEINILDSGGFGTVVITKSVSIVAPGVQAGILAQFDAIKVDAGSNGDVTLRGLDIQGAGSGARGIEFVSGYALHIESCTIRDFRSGAGDGISFAPATMESRLYVHDTLLSKNVTAIDIHPGIAGGAKIMFTRVQMEGNSNGIVAHTTLQSTGSGITMSVRDSVVAGSVTGISVATDLLVAGGPHPPIALMIDHSSVANNGTGIKSTGTFSTVRISASTITGNTIGVSVPTNGRIYPNNIIEGNGDDPKPDL
jgi:hypothetical protein